MQFVHADLDLSQCNRPSPIIASPPFAWADQVSASTHSEQPSPGLPTLKASPSSRSSSKSRPAKVPTLSSDGPSWPQRLPLAGQKNVQSLWPSSTDFPVTWS